MPVCVRTTTAGQCALGIVTIGEVMTPSQSTESRNFCLIATVMMNTPPFENPQRISMMRAGIRGWTPFFSAHLSSLLSVFFCRDVMRQTPKLSSCKKDDGTRAKHHIFPRPNLAIGEGECLREGGGGHKTSTDDSDTLQLTQSVTRSTCYGLSTLSGNVERCFKKHVKDK